jgi:hypothetical protein
MNGSIAIAVPAPATTFDYSAIPADKVTALRAQASHIRGFVKTHTAAVIEAGLDLIAVKQTLPGQFGQWVTAECGFSLATAENFMRAAKFAEGRIATVTILMPATVYKLARKSTPIEIVNAVMDRAMQGEVVPERDVKDALEEVRHQRREAEAKKNRKQVRARTQKKWDAERAVAEKERQRVAAEREKAAKEIVATLGDEQARYLVTRIYEVDPDSWDTFRAIKKIVESNAAALEVAK